MEQPASDQGQVRRRLAADGDLGHRDEDGYFWYRGRADDVITSAGYRIGPGEVEDALLRHPAVRLAAAIGVPDPVRTESIKAFLVLAEGQQPSAALEREISDFVKTRLARHEYPQAIEFVDSLPTTTTGKIMRRELRERERAKMRAGYRVVLLVGGELPTQREVLTLCYCECLLDCRDFIVMTPPKFLQLCGKSLNGSGFG